MKWGLKNKKKKYSIKRLFHSFGYALKGIITVYKTEQNIIIHTVAAILVMSLGIYLQVSLFEACLLIIVIGLVIATEIINTAIEYTIDMTMPNIHPIAKMAKDASIGAVLVMTITSIIVGLIIFLPRITSLI